MCHSTLEYKFEMIVAGTIYVFLGLYFEFFSKEEVATQFKESSLFLLDETSQFNQIFSNYLVLHLGVTLAELLPFVQYVSSFFLLPMDYTLHKECKKNNTFDVSIFLTFFSNLMKLCWGIIVTIKGFFRL